MVLMANGNMGGRSTAVWEGDALEAVEPEAGPLLEALSDALGEAFAAIASMLVAGVTIEAERRQRAARARRAATVRRAA